MKRIGLALLGVLAAGCGGPVVSDGDNRQVRREFSQANYEREMRRLGRGKELDEERARAEKREREERAGTPEEAPGPEGTAATPREPQGGG